MSIIGITLNATMHGERPVDSTFNILKRKIRTHARGLIDVDVV